jgi:hypothetical protein
MLKKLYRTIAISRQASAAEAILNHLSDTELADLGYYRYNFVDVTKAKLIAELDNFDKVNTKYSSASINPNLVGAV